MANPAVISSLATQAGANPAQANQLVQFSSMYPDIGNSVQNGTLSTTSLLKTSQMWSTMLNGVYRVTDNPLYDTQTITVSAANTLTSTNSSYQFFQVTQANNNVSNLSNNPGDGKLPNTQAFLIEKIWVSVTPTSNSNYAYVADTTIATSAVPIPTNVLDFLSIVNNAWIEIKFLTTTWYVDRLVNYVGGPQPAILVNPAVGVANIVTIGNVQMGPTNKFAIERLRESMFVAPQEPYAVFVKFPSTTPQIFNDIDITVNFGGKNFQSAS